MAHSPQYQGADVRTHVAVEIAIFSDTPLTVIRTAIGRQDESAHDTFVSGNYILRTDRPSLGTKKEKQSSRVVVSNSSELRDDGCDVVVLFLSAELTNPIHNCAQQSLARQLPMLAQRFDQIPFAKLFSAKISGLSDAIGVES